MISVLIISKNEGKTIADCINSVKNLAGEIIVVDDSTDDTSKIAEKLGAKVIENKFKNFSDQRNFAASLAKNEWIFYIDSDERVTPGFTLELKNRISRAGENIGGFYIRRKTFFYGRDWHFTDKIQRVFRKSKLAGWHGIVHETPVVKGALETINEPIIHSTHKNFEQMVAKTNEWSEYEANLRLASKHPGMVSWRFFRVMFTGFLKSYFKEGGYRNGTAGIIEALYQTFSMFITYAKLWEKQIGKRE